MPLEHSFGTSYGPFITNQEVFGTFSLWIYPHHLEEQVMQTSHLTPVEMFDELEAVSPVIVWMLRQARINTIFWSIPQLPASETAKNHFQVCNACRTLFCNSLEKDAQRLSCPTIDELTAVASGNVSTAAAASTLTHLTRCEFCRWYVEKATKP